MARENKQNSPFYTDIDENSGEGYDPRTDMFSDAPYELGTDMPVQPRLSEPHVRVSKKKELLKRLIPFLIMFLWVLPFTVTLTFYIKYPVFNLLLPEYYRLFALYAISWLTIMVGGAIIIRVNSGVYSSGFTGIRAALMPLYLVSAGLSVASLIVPESTGILLKLVCISLLAGSAVIIFITAGKKVHRTEKKLYIILMTAVLLLCIGFNCVSKLFMTAIDADTRCVIFTMRDGSALPKGDDRHLFVSMGEHDLGSYSIKNIVLSSREEFMYYSDKTDNPTLTRFLLKDHDVHDDKIIAADNLLVNALHSFDDLYDERFFENNYLVVSYEWYYDHIADINMTDVRANLNRMFFEIDVDFTSSDEEFPTDVCLFLMTLPKSCDPWSYMVQSIKYVETMDGDPYNY